MGQKGSLKDRIRSWKYRRKVQKEMRKRKEQEEWNCYVKQKQNQGVYINPTPKKYNFLQIFFYSIFGLFLGVFDSKKNEKITSPSQLLEEVIELQEKIETLEEPAQILSYTNQIQQKETSLEELLRKQPATKNPAIKECVERIDSIKKQLQKIDTQENHQEKDISSPMESFQKQVTSSFPETKTTTFENQSKEDIIHMLMKEPILHEQGVKEKPKTPVLESNKDIVKDIVNEETKAVTVKEEKLDENEIKENPYKIYLVSTNQKLKKQHKELTKIKEDIKQAKTPNALYKLEASILWIQNQLFLMAKEYEEITKDKEFQYLKNQYEYYRLDENELLKSNQAIQELLSECQKSIDIIDNCIKIPQKELKKSAKKEQKQEKKEQKKPFYLDVDDFKRLRFQIMTDLSRQIEEIGQLKEPFKPSFFEKTKRFLSNTMMVLTPMVCFKNPLTGMLAGSILAHNRIRSMRQMVNKKEAIYETCENLFDEIRSKQDCINMIYSHLNASLCELQQIKQDVIQKYQNIYPEEVEMFLSQLRMLENQVMEKSMSLQMNQQKLIRIKQGYQKTLKK